MGIFYGFGHENRFEQVHKVWPNELIWKEHFLLTFLKKLIFPFSDSTFFLKKIKKFKNEKKRFLRVYFTLP